MHVIINTYNRPRQLNALLDDIFEQCPECNVTVLNDGSAENYKINHDINFITVGHHGKEKYWQLVNRGFQVAKNSDHKYFIYLPDDVRLIDGFFDKAVALYESIKDQSKICLTLRRPKGRDENWTGFKPVCFTNVRLIQWVDMLFIAEKKFFEALYYKLNKIPRSRWANNPKLGSGVGKQISKRLLRSGYNMYQVNSSLVKTPEPTASQMNPVDRKQNPVQEHYE